MSAASQKTVVLSLYRRLLRESSQFTSYNYRNYFLRRIREEFRQNSQVKDCQKIQEFIKKAQNDLAVIKRQVVLGKLYPADKLVVE